MYDIGYSDAIKAINHDESYDEYKKMIANYEYFTLRDGFD